MPLQPPLTKPAYDDLHAILSHYEAKEPGLGHRIARRLRDKLQRGTLNGMSYRAHPGGGSMFRGEGCLFCTVQQELLGAAPDSMGISGNEPAKQWAAASGGGPNDDEHGYAESFVINRIEPGMTPVGSPAADALDACIEDWLHIQEATRPAHSVKVVAQGWTPQELAALKAEVSQ